MRPGPGYAGEPLPINLGADMTRATGSKRGCSRQTMQQLPVVPIAANGNEPGGKAKPAATSTPAAAAQPTKKQRKRGKAASVAGDQGIVVDLSRFKAATTAIMKQYTGAAVRIPGSFFPGFAVPAVGYWLATVGAFADEFKTVWLHIPGEPAFWCSAEELAKLTID